jgi:lysophospholipase L1-like esterase
MHRAADGTHLSGYLLGGRCKGRVGRMTKSATVLTAFVAVFAIGAASCRTIQPFAGTGAPTLQFTGDSITVQSTADINAHFKANHDVGIEAFVGADTREQASQVARDAATSPAIEVINLGTNDAARIGVDQYATINGKRVLIDPASTMEQVLARFDVFVAEFSATTCLVFVTVNTHNPSWEPANAATINDHLRAISPHLVDWDAAWKASYFDAPDNPHPNATGRQALLALEDQAIAGCASSSATTTTTAETTTTP